LVQKILLAQYAALRNEPEVAALAEDAVRILSQLKPVRLQLARFISLATINGLRRLRKI
jgi:hypothetical protein